MIRKNPDLVRKSQPMFANMTDDQIRAYADHIEQAASDPNMMREVERMGKLPVEDRQQLQRLQEGLSGAAPMDDQWVTTAVEVIRSKPQLLKTMLKGKGQLLGEESV